MVSKEEIPEHWDIKTIGDLASAENGYGFKKEFQGHEDKAIPFYKVSDMNNSGNEVWMENSNHTIDQEMKKEMSVKTYPEGTTIFPKIGEAVRTNKKRILSENAVFDNNVMGVVPDKSKINQKYLYYFMQTVDLSDFIRETTVPSIRQSDIENTEIPVPPLEEQEMIVEKLDEIFDSIEEIQDAQEQAENILEDIPSSVLKANIKEDIDKKTAEELCDYIQRGKQPEYDDESGDVKIINQRCIYHDKIHWGNSRALAKSQEDAWQDYRYLQEGDVLINSTGKGTLGRVQIFPGHEEPHVVDGHVTILRSGEDLDPHYLMYYLRSGLGQDQIHSNKSGSTGQTELYKKHVQELEIPVPDLETQKRLVEKFKSIFEQTQDIVTLTDDERDIIEDLPKSVLVEAFKGDLVDFNEE